MNDNTLMLLWVIFIRPSSVPDLNAKLVRGPVPTHVAEGAEGAAGPGTKLETSLRGFEFCSQCWGKSLRTQFTCVDLDRKLN